MAIVAWLALHWIELLQNLGIIGGLLFSAYGVSEAARAQKVQNVFALTAGHRDLWTNVFKFPRLARVLRPEADAAAISDDERLFVQMLILHMRTYFRAGRSGMAFSEEGLRADIRQFFSLPIPKAVWEGSRDFQDPDFRAFVESSIA